MIKFRGQRLDNGEWVEGYYHPLFWMCGNGVEEADIIRVLDGSKQHKINPATLQVLTTDGWADIADVEVVMKKKQLPEAGPHICPNCSWQCSCSSHPCSCCLDNEH